MRTRTILAGISIALLAVPFAASAATVSDLQAEIAGLLAQIEALQPQGSTSASMNVSTAGSIGSAQAGGGSLSGTVVSSSSSCPNFIRSLSVGSTGGDVTSLQQFLSSNGFLNVSATGYFGALTKAALARWQASAGIAISGSAGSGIFGPLSRNYFSGHCGGTGGGVTAQPFSADPTSGAAPLTVSFTTSDSVTSSSTYSVDFGDSSSSAMAKGECVGITAVVGGQGGIRCSFNVSHTYSSNGTYVAKLMKDTCPSGTACFAGPLVVATQTITVGSSTSGGVNFSASPTAGSVPLTVQFTETAPQGNTLATTINYGDGSSGLLGVVPVCSSCNAEAAASHTYTAPGTYNVTLTSGMCSCPANGICNCPNMMIVGTATVTVTGTSTTTSNIQQLNAPGTVTLAQNGIAEIRNESFYFTLNSLTASTATIQLTPVGCWNSFPSDTPPPIRCMIAVVPIPPQTLSIGQSYAAANYGIELTGISNNEATFSVTASATTNSY